MINSQNKQSYFYKLIIPIMAFCLFVIWEFVPKDQQGASILSTIAVLLGVASFQISIQTLNESKEVTKLTKIALEITENALIVSMSDQKIRDLTCSLSNFYYPLSQFSTARETFYCKTPHEQNLLDIFSRHVYWGDPELVSQLTAGLNRSVTVNKAYFEFLMSKVDVIIEQKEEEIKNLKQIIRQIEDSAPQEPI